MADNDEEFLHLRNKFTPGFDYKTKPFFNKVLERLLELNPNLDLSDLQKDNLQNLLEHELNGANPSLEPFLNQAAGYLGQDEYKLRNFYQDLSQRLKEDEFLGNHPQAETFINQIQDLQASPQKKSRLDWPPKPNGFS